MLNLLKLLLAKAASNRDF